VFKPETLKSLIESKLEMDKSDLKKDFLEFGAYLEKMAIIRYDHGHVVDDKNSGDSGTKNVRKYSGNAGRSSGHNPREAALEVAIIRRLTVIERSLVREGCRTREELEISLLRSLHRILTQRSVRLKASFVRLSLHQ
jgi:hypothetical protein